MWHTEAVGHVRGRLPVRLGLVALGVGLFACGRSGFEPADEDETESDPTPMLLALRVERVGNGASFATIVSDPAGIACPPECDALFGFGSRVRLSVDAGPAALVDWQGECEDPLAPVCDLEVNRRQSVTARIATSGSVVWARVFGGSGADAGLGVAAAADGGAVLAGYYEGAGGAPAPGCALPPANAGSIDLFVARFDRQGACRWARGFGGDATDYATAADVAPDGSIAMAGRFESSSVVIGQDTLLHPGTGATESGTSFAVSLTDDGEARWAVPGSFGESDEAVAVCANMDASLAAVEWRDENSNGFNFDTAYRRISGADGATLAGAVTVRSNTVSDEVVPRALACRADGFALVGYHDAAAGDAETVTFPPLSTSGPGGVDAFVAMLGTDAQARWVRTLGGATFDRGTAVASTPAGALTVGGLFRGTFTVDGHAVTYLGDGPDDDFYLLRMDASNGAVQSAATFGGPGDQNVFLLASLGTDGSVALAGNYADPFEMDRVVVPTGGGYDLFVARVDSAFTPVWSRSLGASGTETSGDLASGDGVLYLAGAVVGSPGESLVIETFMGPLSFSLSGSGDVLLVRLVP